MNALIPVTVMLAAFACNAGPAEAQQGLLRTWSGATNSVQTKALAVHRYFTNGCPIRHVVSILGTNYSLVEFIPGDRKATTHLGYSFGEDMVYVETTAPARADPPTSTLTGVSYTFSHQNGAVFSRSVEGQPDGAANGVCLSVVAAVAAPQAGSPVFQMRLVAPEGPEAPQSSGVEKMTATMTNSVNGQIHHETLYVEKTVLLDEKDLKGTKVVTNALQNQLEIRFELTAQGRKRFAEVTRKNIHKRLVIIIDGRLYSAPVIQSEISSGKGQITGNFTPQEASDLSDKINAALKK